MKKQTFLKATSVSLTISILLSSGLSYAQSMDRIFDNLAVVTNNVISEQEKADSESTALSQVVSGETIDVELIGEPQMFLLKKLLNDQLGKPYVYGAYGPDSFDCSGLIYYVFGLAGKTVPRTSQAQGDGGELVDKSNLKFGDLVLFDTRNTGNLQDIKIDTTDVLSLFADDNLTNSKSEFKPQVITHSGIYIGDGKFVHASSGSVMKVVIEELDSKYFAQRYIYAKRY